MKIALYYARVIAFACFAIADFCTVRVHADVAVAEPSNDQGLTVYRMTVTPAGEPLPVFRHRLVSRDIDLTAGNAAPFYYRSLLIFRRENEALRKEFDEERELGNWYSTGAGATPISELPVERVRRAVQMSTGGDAGKELRSATSRRDCDWQTGVEIGSGPELFNFRLEEFQDSRQLSRMLAMRTRLAVAERKYGDALDALRMNYRLAHDVGEQPILVCGLIAAAEVNTANGTLIELISAPDSPNLYWALTELPRPIVDLSRAARFEFSLSQRIFPLLRDAETTSRSAEEWNGLYKEAMRNLLSNGLMQNNANGTASELAGVGFALVGYSHAKKRLIEMGLDRGEVERMAVGQVIAIYTERQYRKVADMQQKLWYLPYAEAQKRASDADRQLAGTGFWEGTPDRQVLPIVSLLMPALSAARSAGIRVERDMAALRVVEALRMYAAGHDGKLPERLDQIDEVPVPTNPATDKPFVYRLEGNTAILELPATDGVPRVSRRFEITMAAK